MSTSNNAVFDRAFVSPFGNTCTSPVHNLGTSDLKTVCYIFFFMSVIKSIDLNTALYEYRGWTNKYEHRAI